MGFKVKGFGAKQTLKCKIKKRGVRPKKKINIPGSGY